MNRHNTELLTNCGADFGFNHFGRIEAHAANNTYPKGGVSGSKDSFMVMSRPSGSCRPIRFMRIMFKFAVNE